MSVIQQLPISFIITALDENPDAQTFPWNGQDIPRSVLEAEVTARPPAVTVGGAVRNAISGIAPVIDASRKKKK